MKVLIIANNLEGNVDGIGKHARIVGNEMKNQGVHVVYSTGTTWQMSKCKLFFSMAMCKAYLKAIYKVLKSDFDFVDVEYPFMEYNPLVLLFHILLWIVTRPIKTKVSLSMHEHDRVKPLRRLMIDSLLPFCDLIFISEEKYFKSMPKYAHKMHLRIIPSHGIKFYSNLKDFDMHTRYCYFGLVNGSKAFEEMLNAWKEFNKDGLYSLDIVTRSNLSNWNLSLYQGVKCYYNLSDDESGYVLSQAVFSIIPVLPEIGYNNSSFVSTIQCGCIPMGIFNDDLKNEPFVLNMKSYNQGDFVELLKQSQTLLDLKARSALALEFGKLFSVEKTASMMISGFQNYIK